MTARAEEAGTGVLIHSARLVTAGPDGSLRDEPDAWLLLRGGSVQASGNGAGWRDLVAPGDEVIDAREAAGAGAVLTPGLVDIHTHGGGGHDAAGDAEDVDAVLAAHARHGVTRVVLSLVSAPIARLVAQADRIGALMPERPGILGVHLEGPFLDTAHCGAHDPAALQSPTPEALDRLLGTGVVRQMTLAPELEGGLAAVRRIVQAGAVAAVGHTDADAGMTRRAIEAGATLLTHAFNAMPPLHHRAPGPVGVALADDRMTLEVIADGHHLDPVVVTMLLRAAPGRVALVSDAMAAAAAPDGTYALGAADVEVRDGVARLRGTEVLAGSTLTLDQAVRNVVGYGVPLATAVAAATAVPATAIGRPDLGRLGTGDPADVVLWTADLVPQAVWRTGVRTA
ncbi:N-acetylglucosamine-6-phosphate deacetylase [Microbacterium caowuchunii]|uniref:N-acetylglucosamine-6-phosphate deacetylase n=1 Tax=Microbacterium caowuchunii TaxID=2614638 RepID=UPI001EE8DCFA|nr:amidohydrolase family protein [Microbacterium caowuchunii]